MIMGTYVRGNSAVSVVINTKAEKEPAINIEQGEVRMEDLTIKDEINYQNYLTEQVRESSNKFMAMMRNYIATDYNKCMGGTK